MLDKKLKNKLRKRQFTCGSWLQIASPVTAEIMANAGFDWLVVDLEHSVIDLAQMQVIFQVLASRGVTALARLSANDPVQAKRVMDAGAAGVVVPNVNSAQDAQAALAGVKYPPQGSRGVGLARAQKYGAAFQSYFKTANSSSIVIAQIEHRRAVENIEAILEVNGIDAFIIGPYDISASYNVAGQFDHPLVKKAISRVKSAVIKHKKSLGMHVVYPDPPRLKRALRDGFNFLVYSVDTVILQHYSTDLAAQVKNLKGGTR